MKKSRQQGSRELCAEYRIGERFGEADAPVFITGKQVFRDLRTAGTSNVLSNTTIQRTRLAYRITTQRVP
jgi:hypothetical protein